MRTMSLHFNSTAFEWVDDALMIGSLIMVGIVISLIWPIVVIADFPFRAAFRKDPVERELAQALATVTFGLFLIAINLLLVSAGAIHLAWLVAIPIVWIIVGAVCFLLVAPAFDDPYDHHGYRS